MSSKSKFVAAVLLVAVGAALVAPVAGAGAAPARGKGEASSTFRAFDLALTHVPQVGDISTSVGVFRLDASTLTAPVANVVIEAIRSGGQSVGSYSASSADPDSSQSVTVPFDGPVTSGEISIAELLAMADSDSATAALGALQSNLDIGPLGMSASSPRQGIKSVADPFGTVSASGFSVGPFALSVGDLLPPDLLSALPLSVVWDLAKNLPVDVADELRTTIRTLRDLVESLDAIETVNAQLDAAQAQLDAIAAGNPAIADAVATVDVAEANVDTATANVTAAQDLVSAAQAEVDARLVDVDGLTARRTILEQQLAGCTVAPACAVIQSQIDALSAQIAPAEADLVAAQTDLVSAESALDDAQSQLDVAEAALDDAVQELEALLGDAADLENLVDELEGELESLLDTLEELVASIPNLDDLISDVVFEIAGTPLFEIGKIEVMSIAQSDAVDAGSDVGCKISGARLLGEAIPGTNCDTVKQAWGEVEAAITGILDSLPVSNLPQISVEGLHTYALASDGPDAAGFNSASAGLSALHIGIPSVALTDITDQLVANVTAQLEAILGTDIPDAGLASILDQITAQLDALPTGDALEGLRTVGVDAAMAEVANHSRFRANNATIAPPNPHNPPGPSAPNNPQPHAPMPFTGHEVSYWAVMAGVLLAVGAMVWAAGRRWENAMEIIPSRITRPAPSPSASMPKSVTQAVPIVAAAAAIGPTRQTKTAKPASKSTTAAKASARAKTSAQKPKTESTRSATTGKRSSGGRVAGQKAQVKRPSTGAKRVASVTKASAKRVVVRKTTVRRPAPRKASAR